MTARRASLVNTLASASAALLGLPAAAAPAPWKVSTGTLVFTEFEQVSGTELALRGTTPLTEESDLTLGAVLDVLVGASPNGATPSNVAQTFTTPSGFDSYRASANEVPLDGTFQDNRLELSGSLAQRYARTARASYGAKASLEFDYMSVGVDTRWQFDNEARDTAWSAGAAVSHDRIHPVGGIPRELASMAPPDTPQPRRNAALTKNVFDLLFGVSRVLSRRTVGQLNYSQTFSDGYHADPYKIVSVVDAASGATVDYLHEARPGERTVRALAAQVKHRLPEAVADVSYRVTRDDWDVRTHTLDLRYRVLRAAGEYWEPHVRLYQQSAARFYRHSITDAEAPSGSLSADRRLAAFDALTLGASYGRAPGPGESARGAFRLSLEYYQQFGERRPDDAVGVQRGLDLLPDNYALLFRYSSDFDW